MPVDADKGMLRRLVTVRRWILEGANHMGGRIRIAHADIYHGDAQPRHFANPPDRLGQIRREGIVLPRAPGALDRRSPRTGLPVVRVDPLAIRNAVVDIQPRGKDEAGNFRPDGSEDVPRQAGTVFQAPAKWPGAGLGSQQLAEQIAVALLDVDKLKAATMGQPGSRDIV